MKYFTVALVFLLLGPVSLFAQKSGDDPLSYYSKNFEREVQDWVNNKYKFPPGHYYKLAGKLTDGEIPPLLLDYPYHIQILGCLFDQNIVVEEAWYRPEATNCEMYEVMVESSFLIRVKDNSLEQAMSKYGFVKEENPSPGYCPNAVIHYVFKN